MSQLPNLPDSAVQMSHLIKPRQSEHSDIENVARMATEPHKSGPLDHLYAVSLLSYLLHTDHGTPNKLLPPSALMSSLTAPHLACHWYSRHGR